MMPNHRLPAGKAAVVCLFVIATVAVIATLTYDHWSQAIFPSEPASILDKLEQAQSTGSDKHSHDHEGHDHSGHGHDGHAPGSIISLSSKGLKILATSPMSLSPPATAAS